MNNARISDAMMSGAIVAYLCGMGMDDITEAFGFDAKKAQSRNNYQKSKGTPFIPILSSKGRSHDNFALLYTNPELLSDIELEIADRLDIDTAGEGIESAVEAMSMRMLLPKIKSVEEEAKISKALAIARGKSLEFLAGYIGLKSSKSILENPFYARISQGFDEVEMDTPDEQAYRAIAHNILQDLKSGQASQYNATLASRMKYIPLKAAVAAAYALIDEHNSAPGNEKIHIRDSGRIAVLERHGINPSDTSLLLPLGAEGRKIVRDARMSAGIHTRNGKISYEPGMRDLKRGLFWYLKDNPDAHEREFLEHELKKRRLSYY